MSAELPPWRELSAAEQAACHPFLLDLSGLCERDIAKVRSDFIMAGMNGVRAMAAAIERVPNQEEIDILRRALATFFNSTIIPPLRRGTIH